MPRNGSGVYSLPAGYQAVDGQTATAAQHNDPLEDLESDLNAARPISAGGTGATSASAARTALGVLALDATTTYTRTLLDDADAAEARTTLGAFATAGGTFTGPVKFLETQETPVPLSGATPTVNLKAGTVFELTTSGNTTFTFSNPAASGTVSAFTLVLTAGGAHTVTWPASVAWQDGAAPDAPDSGETDVLVFFTMDAGTTYFGFVAGNAMQ